MAKFLILTLILIPLIPSSLVIAINNTGLSRDRDSLLTFLTGISSDPDNALASWRTPSTDVCNWTGITCHPIKRRVVQLDVKGMSLSGVISPALANLSFLAVLDLSNNYFIGQIPAELGGLPRLKELSLTTNYLSGLIPKDIGLLKKLVYLDFGGNQLTGGIPETLLCNCTSLQYVDLSNNSLSGEIAVGDQCRLNDLRFLLLWSNNLNGAIPPALSNYSRLEWIDLESNFLTGGFPSDFNKLGYLQFLHLSYNNFSTSNTITNLDPFFTSLNNCTYLQELELAGNNIRGVIPVSVGDLSISLHQLHLEENLIYGSIPANISNLVNLTYLNLSNNLLNGSIPHDISRLRKLERVYLSNNLLSGEIPASLGQIQHLGLLDISGNYLSGTIPDTFSNLLQLRWLILHHNQLSNTIPSSLGNCINLETLDLSYNQLTGGIPSSVAALTSLKLYLNLSNNFLSGSLPKELSKMDMIIAMDLSSNNLSGSIPSQLGSCIALEYLNLSSNSLQGLLPSSVGSLPYLESLDLSMNQLTGAMPKSLQASTSLKHLNLSFNKFSGMVLSEGAFATLSDDSFLGNPGLCGSISGMSSCISKQVHHFATLPIILTLLGSSSCIVCLFGIPRLVRARRKTETQKLAFQHSMIRDEGDWSRKDYPRISYRELVEATGGFSDLNLIGSGRFGRVYKGILSDELRIAVKVLSLKIDDSDSDITGSFKRECEVLGRTRHRNLMKIITTCSKPDFKALVLPLMPNGSLDNHLYPPDGSNCCLNLVQLVSIASNIAEGIAYLHHHSPVRVVHCDLKPSNVLLDQDMTAIVSDFGISKLVKGGGGSDEEGSSDTASSGYSCISTTGLLHGSVGYIAPEYGLGGHPSIQGDVYSFGVLLLEMLTGKRPTDVIFHEGLSLQEWVKKHYPHNIEHLISPACCSIDWPLGYELLYYEKPKRDVVMEMIELGLVCTHYAPSMRPTMMDVAHELALLKLDLSRNGVQPPSLLSK